MITNASCSGVGVVSLRSLSESSISNYFLKQIFKIIFVISSVASKQLCGH